MKTKKNKITKIIIVVACLMFALSLIPLSVAAEEASVEASADGLVTFDGYSARKIEYNGLRSQYTLNTSKLAELEELYTVEVGMLISPTLDDSEASYKSLTTETAVVKKVFYTTNDKYIGKYYDVDKTDSEIEFVYSVTYNTETGETKEKFETSIFFRAYIILTDSHGASQTVYVDNSSNTFGYAVCMADVASCFTSTADNNYPMLQRVQAICEERTLSHFELMGKSIDRYSIVVDTEAATSSANAFNTAFKTATGYTLPIIVNTSTPEESASYSDAYIYIKTTAKLSSSNSYNIKTSTGNAYVEANNTTAATAAVKALVKALKNKNYATIGNISYDPDWTPSIK